MSSPNDRAEGSSPVCKGKGDPLPTFDCPFSDVRFAPRFWTLRYTSAYPNSGRFPGRGPRMARAISKLRSGPLAPLWRDAGCRLRLGQIHPYVCLTACARGSPPRPRQTSSRYTNGSCVAWNSARAMETGREQDRNRRVAKDIARDGRGAIAAVLGLAVAAVITDCAVRFF